MKTITNIIYPALAVFAFTCFAVLPRAQAVSPAPDGCYPGFTTAEGCNALNFLTTGAGNTGVGWYSLYVNTSGSYNTGLGAGALILNNGDSNTATGAAALLLNTSGANNTANGTDALTFNTVAFENTAVGTFALFNNDSDAAGLANDNTAVGASALESNVDGDSNNAVGAFALFSNTTGAGNTAVGSYALYSNTTAGVAGTAGTGSVAIGYDALSSNVDGERNTAVGAGAMSVGTTGSRNTATGRTALNFNTGDRNTADGHDALYSNTTGNDNIAVGNFAGFNLDTGDNNIDIGNQGVAGESNSIRIGDTALQTATFIAGIRGTTTGNGDAITVVIDSAGQLGTMSSSQRFKKEIKPMDQASEAILALRPVTFHYKNDTKETAQFGLVAEEVAKVNPDLVVRDAKGEVYTVRYEAVNAMLLNEFLKEHHQVQDLKAIVAQQQKQIEALTSGLRKVSDQLELSKPAPQTVANDPR